MNTTLNCLALLVLIGSLVEIVAVDLAAGQAVDVDTSPFRMSRNLRRTYQAISECPRSARKLRRLCNQSCISKSSPDCIEWKEKLFRCCERRECTCEDQNQLDPALPESSLEPSSAPSKAPSVGGPSTGGVDPEPGVDGPSTGGVDPEPSTELPDLNGWWEKNKPCGIVSCP